MSEQPAVERFKDHVALRKDGDLRLELDRIYALADSPWMAPAYRFHMVVNGQRVGTISLRVGFDERLIRYAGQIGFGVEPKFRGRRYAGRAVQMLLPLADSHGLQPLWLGCNPDNDASKRAMRWLGAKWLETVDLPDDYHRYRDRGELQKERYRLDYKVSTIQAERGLERSAVRTRDIFG